MNERSGENLNPVVLERKTEQLSLASETVSKALADTFSQVEKVQGEGDDIAAPDVMMGLIVDRLGADEQHVKAAQEEVNFFEYAAALIDTKKSLKKKFDRAVQRALLPVATVLALNSAPVQSQELQVERPVKVPESSVVVRVEPGELVKGDVFDLQSPLNIIGEKMKTLKQEWLPGELALLKDLYNKAWQEKNEWAADSWLGEDGIVVAKITEGDEDRVVTVEWLSIFRKPQKNEAFSHTHPMRRALSELPLGMERSGREQLLSPPSSGDINFCTDPVFHSRTHRVVDARGVWEYRCDTQNPSLYFQKTVIEKLRRDIEDIGQARGLEQHDMALLRTALKDVTELNNPTYVLTEYFSVLDKIYPGIEESSRSSVNKLFSETKKYTRELVDNDASSVWLRDISSSYTDEELAVLVKIHIENAEKKGVLMSFTPFKKFSKIRGVIDHSSSEDSRGGEKGEK